MSPDELFNQLRPFIPQAWIDYRGAEYAQAVCALYQEKLVKLSEIVENAWYFFDAPRVGEPLMAPSSVDGSTEEGGINASSTGQYNPAAVDKLLLSNADAPRAISELFTQFESVTNWDATTLEQAVDAFCEASGLGRGKVMQPWRVALTGDKVSPGFTTCWLSSVR